MRIGRHIMGMEQASNVDGHASISVHGVGLHVSDNGDSHTSQQNEEAISPNHLDGVRIKLG
jgi:hypothetical protein